MLQYSFDLMAKTPRQDGTMPLKVKIYRSRTEYAYISLKIYLLPEQWDGRKVVNNIEAQIINGRLNNYRVAIGKVLLEIDESGEIPSMTEVRFRIEVSLGQKQSKPATFIAFGEQYAAKVPERRTRENFYFTIDKVRTYDPVDRSFSNITVGWLRGFEAFYRSQGLGTNTLSIHLRNIRTIFNRAIDDSIAKLEDYPFRRFRIRQEETRKRALSLEQLRMLRDFPCTEAQKQYRDIFMLIFYLRGINIGDLFKLKSIDDGYIYYSRSKTKKPYAIKVEPEAMDIIGRYQGKEHLLSAADRYKSHYNFLGHMNKALQAIGAPLKSKDSKTKPGPPPVDADNGSFPGLTSYWARHTGATLMALLDVPESTISMALGHSGNNKTTQIYIDFDQRKVDAANRMMIDLVNSDISTEKLIALQHDKLIKPVWEAPDKGL